MIGLKKLKEDISNYVSDGDVNQKMVDCLKFMIDDHALDEIDKLVVELLDTTDEGEMERATELKAIVNVKVELNELIHELEEKI